MGQNSKYALDKYSHLEVSGAERLRPLFYRKKGKTQTEGLPEFNRQCSKANVSLSFKLTFKGNSERKVLEGNIMPENLNVQFQMFGSIYI